MDTLTRLSDTRWRYETAGRVYYVRQVTAPTADVWGVYWVDGGTDHTGVLAADSIEHVADELRQGQPVLVTLADAP